MLPILSNLEYMPTVTVPCKIRVPLVVLLFLLDLSAIWTILAAEFRVSLVLGVNHMSCEDA